MSRPSAIPAVDQAGLDAAELLEQLRTAAHDELYRYNPDTLDRVLRAAHGVIDQCTETRGRIKVAAQGREPTASQRRDMEQADVLRREYLVLAERINRVAEEKAAVYRQVDYGQVIDARGSADDPGTFHATGTGYHVGGGHTYNRDDVRTSWVKDMLAANLNGDPAARERLVRNNREVAAETRALSATDGAGGEWVPPLWLMREALQLARAGRVVADQVQKMQLPPGTDSISLPRLATGTATGEQATQNSEILQTDATTNSIEAKVATIAGGQTVSLQLVEQSPVPVDQLILQDLLADLATKVDTFVLSNNAAGKVGLLNVAGLNAITYTDADPTVAELYRKVADAIQQIHTGRFLPPTKVFMAPRRWAWFTAASDTTGRPLVVPAAQMPENAAAAMGAVTSEGFVGSLQGLPVFVDPNIPTNLGAGTNEDRIVVARANDVVLMESPPKAEVFREPLASQMSVFLRVYEYVALHASRYPKSISVISGTGLAAPTF